MAVIRTELDVDLLRNPHPSQAEKPSCSHTLRIKLGDKFDHNGERSTRYVRRLLSLMPLKGWRNLFQYCAYALKGVVQF